MKTITLTLENMSCPKCVEAVRRALSGLDGVETERVEIGTAVVRMEDNPAQWSAVRERLDDAGHPVSSRGD